MAGFPSPPLRPYGNPWGASGQAVSSLGEDIQKFGEDQAKSRALVQELVQRRTEKILAEERAAAEQKRLDDAAQRQADAAAEADAKRAKTEKIVGQIRDRLQSGKPLTRAEELAMYAGENLEAPAHFFSPDPEKPEGPVNWQTVERPDGTYQVNPRTGQTRKVSGVPVKPPATSTSPTVEQLDAQLKVWDDELSNQGPAPKRSDYEAYQDWLRTNSAIRMEIRKIKAQKAGVGARAPAAGAADTTVTLDENNPAVQYARHLGYTDEQIRQYLASKGR